MMTSTLLDMWLACCTQEEIAEAEEMTHQSVGNKIADFANFGNFAKICKTKAEYLDDYEIPVYNIWKQQNKTDGGGLRRFFRKS
jgi:hypothetical protein